MPFIFAELGGLPCYRSPLLAAFPEVLHGFFTRRGGVSPEPFHSLNLSFTVGDQGPLVVHNRDLVQQALGLNGLVSATQVHGCRAFLVTAGNPASPAEIPDSDILLTQQRGLGLLIKQADCQAVMLYDPGRRVAANVHCGWRGQVANILREAVTRLQERFGCRPQDLVAALGPSLGPCCAEFRNYREEFPPELWPYQVRPTYFDLWALSRDQLQAAGLKSQQIDIAGICTRCRDEEFFSFRRDRITGRQGAVIALRLEK
ncbi:MAG: laccase domain-containing protein [Deltaproteobacteria bacterium]|nr:laccase domain-containing protein [Deltaproteobacteria bacterium]MBI4795112.1 laccase domain-containing protein [Deltaproteobacteria bacterium]